MATPSEDLKKAQKQKYFRDWATRNRDKLNSAQARFREKHKARLSDEAKARRKAMLAAMSESELAAFKAAENAETKRRYVEMRDAVYLAYGGRVCRCCGETEALFLSIDHVDNDGAKMRREVHGKSAMSFYRYLVKNSFPAGYQVLCMNCQVGKYKNGGTCPHQVTCNDYPGRE